MRARSIKQKHVMDELGLKRMNPSIWLSCRGGTKVDPEVIMRLERWLQSNAAARLHGHSSGEMHPGRDCAIAITLMMVDSSRIRWEATWAIGAPW